MNLFESVRYRALRNTPFCRFGIWGARGSGLRAPGSGLRAPGLGAVRLYRRGAAWHRWRPMDSLARLRLHHLDLALDQAQPEQAAAALQHVAAQKLGVARDAVQQLQVVRRSLDVRRQRPRYSYSVDVSVPARAAARLVRQGRAQEAPTAQPTRWRCRTAPDGPPPVVIGAGPAGLLAALTLAQAGWPPVVFERGEAVQERARSVSMLYARGVLNTESNVCFGEGGAGTFSDGKLYTRVGDARVDAVLRALVAHGAHPDILINNRPHLGTDKLVALLTTLRGQLRSLGAQMHYNTRVTGLQVVNGALRGVMLADGRVVETRHVILATGHSARDMWHILADLGLPLEARPFAVGFRVEHPQPLIDSLRYGRASTCDLPAADYRLAYNETHNGNRRGVYSFCMCPGGVVVTTPTQPGALCINGMSHASRKGRFANSALVVSVGLEDFAAAGFSGTFAGADFQHAAEQRAYAAGGGAFVAPASRVTDFMAQRASRTLGPSSYRRGLTCADLHGLYPATVTAALQRALHNFDQSMPGFITEDATLIGVETRTASPIRLARDASSLQVPGCEGLYPAGEGMGYGGGIVSAAVDGMRTADALLARVGAAQEVMDGPL